MLLYVIVIILITAVALWQKQKGATFASSGEKQELASDNVRSLDRALVCQDKSVIIIYGSQTGTAEEYARRLARNLYDDYSISAEVADIEDFDASSLHEVAIKNSRTGRRVLVCFILATYGDGEPTDSTASFYQDLTAIEAEDGEGDLALRALHYIAFGLGNSTYEKFNFMIRSFDEHLQRLGAARLGARGEGDDSHGTLDEDFLSWKDETLVEVASHLRAKKTDNHFSSAYKIVEKPDLTIDSDGVFLGGRKATELESNGLLVGPFDGKNSYLAPLVCSEHLFAASCDRDCLHIEFDISGTNLSYETGDHLGVLPTNPDAEVQRMLKILGLSSKGDTVITISERDGSGAQVIVAEPTTYSTILRYKLDICGRVSREICGTLATMAPNAEVKAHMIQLAADRDLFHSTVTSRCLNLAQFLETASNGLPWSSLPFSFLLSCLAPLQPRYYSISSSGQASPKTIHITIAVKDESLGVPNSSRFLGLTTNYLKALTIANNANGEISPNRTLLPSPGNESLPSMVAVHVRRSNFRLPASSHIPIIMIGPGTGVAPFRAFMQDRRMFAKTQTQKLGMSILFTGSRKRSEDYIYADEWEDLKAALGNEFQMHTAFSRESAEKVYVQHRMMEVKEQLFDLIHNKKAWIYICGDAAHMAKDVSTALVDIVAEGKSIGTKDAVNYITNLKDSGRMHEDIW
ncbi:hypothetical protein VE00_03311 [Pseudogymnoascus sp. WSF 3629]|nr:hypothetical protein VE00_03311 [Pseudogymnoascus sp. WSF 3629]